MHIRIGATAPCCGVGLVISALWLACSGVGCDPPVADQRDAQAISHPGASAVQTESPPAASAQTPPSNADRSPRHSVSVGPWGELWLNEIMLSPPLGFVDFLVRTGSSAGGDAGSDAWHFVGHTIPTFTDRLRDLGMPQDLSESLLASCNRVRLSDGSQAVMCKPDDEVRLAIPAAVRRELYIDLMQSELNFYHVRPQTFVGDSVDDWFVHADLESATVDLLRNLIVSNGRVRFFCDLPLLRRQIKSPSQLRAAVEALVRHNTLLVQLRVRPGDDIRPIVGYWGGMRRAKAIAPLLFSLAAQEEETLLDVVHLLSPFARRLLYTYPDPDMPPPAGGSRDCHWTALNFWLPVIDDQMTGQEKVLRVTEERYRRKDGPPEFGDLISYQEDGVAYHSAVYIAADIAFTKNGANPSTPWMFMRLDDLEHFYPRRKVTERIVLEYTGEESPDATR